MNAHSYPARPAREHRPVAIYIPLTIVVWLVLIPLAAIATPFVLLIAPFWRINPFSAVAAMFSLLIALGGVRVQVEAPGARVNLF